LFLLGGGGKIRVPQKKHSIPCARNGQTRIGSKVGETMKIRGRRKKSFGGLIGERDELQAAGCRGKKGNRCYGGTKSRGGNLTRLPLREDNG